MHDQLPDVQSKLLEAAKLGDLETLRSLLDSAPHIDETGLVGLVDSHGATVAHLAARNGHLDLLEYVTARAPKLLTARSRVGAEVVHDAAATGHLDCVQWLIQKAGCNPDDTDDLGNNPLHLAARYGHMTLVKYLASECGTNIRDKTQSGAIPLHFAAARGDLDIVKYLVEQKPGSINAQMNNGATCTYLAAQEGRLECLRYLVEEGGSTVKILAYDGMSCLHAAAQMGHCECVKWLVQYHGMKVNDKDFDGATPLHLAASQGHVEVMTWLLDNGARMSVDALGGTPLHDAAEHGQLQSVRVLLQRGCDINLKDQDGLTARQLAQLCWQAECAALLRDRSEDTLSTYQSMSYTNTLPKPTGYEAEDGMDIALSSSSSTQSLHEVHQHQRRDTSRRRTVSRPSSVSSKSSQTDQSIPPDTSDDVTSVTSSDNKPATRHHIVDNSTNTSPIHLPTDGKFFTLPLASVPPPPPPPPPPPLPPMLHVNGSGTGAKWGIVRNKLSNNSESEFGSMKKSFSTNTISTSTPSKDKKLASNMTESSSVDLIAELKAANGMASLKRVKRRDAGSSQYYGGSCPPSPPDDPAQDSQAGKAFKSVVQLKAFVSGLQRGSDNNKDVIKSKVVLADDYDPKKFLDKVPETDTTGRPMPPWKRLLVARQLAEKAQRDDGEHKKKAEEEARYKDMPLWKRSLLQKRDMGIKEVS